MTALHSTQTVTPTPSTPASPPRVTVTVPTYNYARFLGGCVESVLSQSGVDVEVVIVDDASTDETEVVSARLATDDRVRVIRHERNQGHIATYNDGLLSTETDYAVLLSADDLLPAGALERGTALLEAHPEVGFVYGHPAPFSGAPPDPRRGRAKRTRTKSWTLWSGETWIRERCESGYNPISSPEVIMRTSVMRDVGGLKASLPHTGDLELWMQLAARADVGRVNGPAQACYRVHPGSMQRTVHTGLLIDLQGRRDAFDTVFAGPAGEWPGAASLHATARRTLARQALDRACRAYERGHTDEVPVDDLVAFAVELWPAADTLPEWRALARRRRVGARHAPHMPPFVAHALVRRTSETIDEWRWKRTGRR